VKELLLGWVGGKKDRSVVKKSGWCDREEFGRVGVEALLVGWGGVNKGLKWSLE